MAIPSGQGGAKPQVPATHTGAKPGQAHEHEHSFACVAAKRLRALAALDFVTA